MGKRQLVAAVMGVVVSAYSVYVEGRKREDEDFQPVCNINSWSSCTSAFEHPVGTGFGFICDITGEGVYVIHGGSVFDPLLSRILIENFQIIFYAKRTVSMECFSMVQWSF